MNMRVKISELNNYYGSEVTIKGFVEKVRDLQPVIFIVIRDLTGKVQLTIEKSDKNNEKIINQVAGLTNESTVTVKGTVIENDKVKLNGMEIHPTDVIVTSLSKEEIPIDLKNKEKSLRETRLDYRFLDLRREENILLFKAQTALENAMREYWLKEEFIEIHSPKIAKGAAESGAEVFKLDYFGTEACLSQSPQFYKQMAMAAGFGSIFEIGPAFRAENSHTSYHATEINMADTEISFIDDEYDIMDFQERWMKYSLSKLKEIYGNEIKETFGVEISNTNVSFPKITFRDAKRILKEEFNYVGEKEDDFERKEENLICKYVKEKYGSDFVFVTKFPYSARPFYHMLDEEGLTRSYDLLYKGIEITTGAQREHRPEILTKQMEEKGIDPKSLDFYVDFFRYGCPPHGGFGFGIARLVMQIFEIDNIREATFIYRGPNRLNP